LKYIERCTHAYLYLYAVAVLSPSTERAENAISSGLQWVQRF